MKREELEALGLTKEQIDKVLDQHHAEMTPAKENLTKTQDELKLAQEKVGETDRKLKELEGLDKDGYEKQIQDLKDGLALKEKEHSEKMSNRDFEDNLKSGIASAKGLNEKAITSLLDLDALKASKNQKDDIDTALKALTEAEDSKMLFGESEPTPIGTGNVIGAVGRNNGDEKPTTLADAIKIDSENKQ